MPHPSFHFLRRCSVKRAASCALALAGLLGAPRPARALQPLGEFLAGARRANVDNREAALTAVAKGDEQLAAIGRATPALTARGLYTRNQYQAAITFSPTMGAPPQTLVIQPYNQWNAQFELDVPIIDLAAWARIRAAQKDTGASRFTVRATLLDVQKQVARSYYQLIGAAALLRSAERTLTVAQSNYTLTKERRSGGVATALDVERAAAEVARDQGNIADAELSAELAGRALATLTGIAPSGEAVEPEDDLHPEPPLQKWESTSPDRIPALAAAKSAVQSAEASALASKLTLLPTLAGSAIENLTNTTGFLGRASYYTLGLSLTWHLDLTTIASLREQSTAAGIARVRADRTSLRVHDQIHEDWQRVRANIAKSRAARAQVKAARLASSYASERYGSGAGTQLDVVQAQRDAFAAEVALIQADADLAYARALLRLDAGHPLDGERTDIEPLLEPRSQGDAQ